MKIEKYEKVETDKVTSVTLICDRCGKQATSDKEVDWIESQEFLTIQFVGGYGIYIR